MSQQCSVECEKFYDFGSPHWRSDVVHVYIVNTFLFVFCDIVLFLYTCAVTLM